MGLLNHLFGSKKSIAEELIMDDNKRMKLWDEHINNYALREKLSKHFNFGNVDKALQDFEATDNVLKQIEALISPELINISDEEKTDEEILADLKRLKNNLEIQKLSSLAISVKQKQGTLLKIFHEIHNVLKAELHLVRLIRKNPLNSRDLLLRLFEIISHQEARLYKVFKEPDFLEENKHIHQDIMLIAKVIIIEEEIKEELESDEEKFVRVMIKQMSRDESKNSYRKLGENIFSELAEMSGAPILRSIDTDITESIKHLEKIMKNDEVMYKIVKKLRPKYDDIKIRGVILAFRKAYDLGHFLELQSEFVT